MTAYTMTVDASHLTRKVEQTLRVMATAEGMALKAKAGVFIDTFTTLAPKDTNRFVNGFIDAGRKAGIIDRPLLPYVPSVRRGQFLEALEKQVADLEKRVRSDQSMMANYQAQDAFAPPRKDGKPRKKRVNSPYYKKMAARLRRTEKRLVRAREELIKAAGSELFLYFAADAVAERGNQRKLSTVRDKVYGGEGRVVAKSSGTVVELINREPHARIVERNPRMGHPVATAHAVVASAGKPLVLAAYRRALQRSPMAGTTGRAA